MPISCGSRNSECKAAVRQGRKLTGNEVGAVAASNGD